MAKDDKKRAGDGIKPGEGHILVQAREYEDLKKAVGAKLRGKKINVRVGIDFEGTVVDLGGLYVKLHNEHMDMIYNPDGKTPEKSKDHYITRASLKGQRTWYLPAGLSDDAVAEMLEREFERVASGEPDRILAIKKPNGFLGTVHKFGGSGILTAAPHRMEDEIKDYLAKVIGKFYYPKDKENKFSYQGGTKEPVVVQMDVDSIQGGTLAKYDNSKQARYNLLVDDSGILGKAVYESWVREPDDQRETAEVRLILIRNEENATLMKRIEAAGLPETGVVTIVNNVDEAFETLNVLYDLLQVYAIEKDVLIENQYLGGLIHLAHKQVLENVDVRFREGRIEETPYGYIKPETLKKAKDEINEIKEREEREREKQRNNSENSMIVQNAIAREEKMKELAMQIKALEAEEKIIKEGDPLKALEKKLEDTKKRLDTLKTESVARSEGGGSPKKKDKSKSRS